MNYQYVVWDWNGTLLDDMKAAYDAVSISLRERGMFVPDRKFYADNFSFPVREYYKKLGFDFAVESYEDLAKEFFKNYLQQKIDLRTHAKKVLEKLFLNSVKQYILSASERQLLLNGLKEHNVSVYFTDVIALPSTEADSKIAAGKAYFTTNRPEGKGIMIGDTEHDVETAKELGLDCVLIESGTNSRERLERTGAKIIDDLTEIVDIVLGKKSTKPIDYPTPEKAERRSFDLSEANRTFKENYHSYYNDVKNTNKTEDW